MTFRKSILFWIALFFHLLSLAQDSYRDFGFVREQNISVSDKYSDILQYAWAGGMNSVRFSEIDINLDGKKDLVAFEKNGNRILPFIYEDNGQYRYAPEYVNRFPNLKNWAMFVDYNGDGKEDIFSYGIGGIMVYKNTSSDKLSFELVTEQLEAFYFSGYTNLYSSPDDYIAIVDMDGDGDMDILNFGVLGQFVQYFKNRSMENGKSLDEFDFHLDDSCWGKFAEGEDSNILTLDADCNNDQLAKSDQKRHVGSTLFVTDFSGDGVPDLILGDADYPDVALLTNGGTAENAIMISQTTDFPNAQTPIHLFSMPAINFIDINHDGKQEILASPSDPSLLKSQSSNSVWMYEMNDITGQYELSTTSFLQEQMIDVGSGAYPVLFDWDEDGLLDLFIANYGYYDSSTYINGFLISYYSSSIAYFKNIGDKNSPKFELITDDFGDLRHYNYKALYPAFGDFDGDNKTDMLCGNIDGTLLLFINQSTGDEIRFDKAIVNYQNIDAGDFSTPQFFDLNKDGKQDLLIGNRRGFIHYYKNISENNIPLFELISDTLGKVDTRDYSLSYFGYSVPHFFRNANDETLLFCGSEQGNILYYKDIDDNLDGTFSLALDAMYELYGNRRYTIREGIRVAPCVGDIDGNGYVDLLVGNWAGGLSYFKGIIPPDSTVNIVTNMILPSVSITPNPCHSYFQVTIPPENTPGEFFLYDITGRLVGHNRLSEIHTNISTSHLKEGIYIGKVILREEVISCKIMILME